MALPLTQSLSSSVAALDKVEAALTKFNDGPFFLRQFSLVCPLSIHTHVREKADSVISPLD
jgi:hypothetical protein